MRTDEHRNPAAFTTDIAKQAGLVLGSDYEIGKPFDVSGHTFYTAKLLGDPVLTTIRVINKIGFYTHAGAQRWTYIGIPQFVWNKLDGDTRARVIGFMYQHEGGTEMRGLFPG